MQIFRTRSQNSSTRFLYSARKLSVCTGTSSPLSASSMMNSPSFGRSNCSGDIRLKTRPAFIEKNIAANVRIILELLDVIFFGAPPNFPIYITQIVAGDVRPICREFRAVPEKRAAMQPIKKTFDDHFREERKIIDCRER